MYAGNLGNTCLIRLYFLRKQLQSQLQNSLNVAVNRALSVLLAGSLLPWHLPRSTPQFQMFFLLRGILSRFVLFIELIYSNALPQRFCAFIETANAARANHAMHSDVQNQ